MLGSHNTMTYLPPRFLIFKPFSFLWKCQDKSLFEQIEKGVKYLDIRVRYDRKNKVYRFAHGIVDLKHSGFNSIRSLCNYLTADDVNYRIILERGNKKDKQRFISEITLISCSKTYDNFVYGGIKTPWMTVFKNIKFNHNLKDYSYVPFYTDKFPFRLNKIKLTTIKKHAKQNNPKIDDNILKDDCIHFMDYVTINN